MNLHKFVESLTSTEKRELLEILSKKSDKRLTVKEWIYTNRELSMRARNALTYSDLVDVYMDEITENDLLKIRNLGKVTFNEIMTLYPFIKRRYARDI